MIKPYTKRLITGGLGCLIGLLLLLFGLGRTLPVLAGPAGEQAPEFADAKSQAAATVQASERSLVLDVTMAGVKRWPSGDLQKMYTVNESGDKVDASGKAAPKDCPT